MIMNGIAAGLRHCAERVICARCAHSVDGTRGTDILPRQRAYPPSTASKCRNRPDLGADPPSAARVNASCPCGVRRCGIWLVRTMQVLDPVPGRPAEPSHVPFPAAMLPAGGALTG